MRYFLTTLFLLTLISCSGESKFGSVVETNPILSGSEGPIINVVDTPTPTPTSPPMLTPPAPTPVNFCKNIDESLLQSRIYYKKDDPLCQGILRRAECKDGEIELIGGDDAYDQLTCTIQTPKTNCTKGKVLKIGVDLNNDEIVDQYIADITSYEGKISSKDNYDYYSYSAHPQIDITPKGYAQHIYFYEGSDGLTLGFYYNVDEGGSDYNAIDVDLKVINNKSKDDVILSDDKLEIKKIVSNKDFSLYEGRYQYWRNTDGAVVGPFSGEDFKIIMSPQDFGDIQESKFYSANGEIVSLTVDTNLSYIIEYVEEKKCTN